jgi:hypothetical protein
MISFVRGRELTILAVIALVVGVGTQLPSVMRSLAEARHSSRKSPDGGDDDEPGPKSPCARVSCVGRGDRVDRSRDAFVASWADTAALASGRGEQ